MFVWTIWDVFQLTALALLVLVVLLFGLHRMVYQWRCKHDGGYGETSACDAICHKCGKNLGFIGEWRTRAHSRNKS